MAYYLTYQCQFNNRNTNNIRVEFWKKDGATVDLTYLPCVSVTSAYYDGNEEKYSPTIIGLKLEVRIRAQYGSNSAINNEMFYPESSDQWKVIAYCDDVCFFKGFVVNDIEPYQLKDKPYDIVVRATDQLMKLKNFELSDASGVEFEGRNTIISYIAGALAKTGLECNIVTLINSYNAAHDNRTDVGSPDMLTQTQIHHRTFLKDVSNFYDCYTALERILKGWAVLYQFQGEYVIYSVGELQLDWVVSWYKSTYNYLGVFASATTELAATSGIGKQKFIQPIELDQFVSYQYPLKEVKTVYKYEIPENLVNNQKIQELGTQLATPLPYPHNTSTYVGYDLVGWTHHRGAPTGETAPDSDAYIMTEVDTFGSELARYYIVFQDSRVFDTSLNNYIRNDNDDFFVDVGDKLTISFRYRFLWDEIPALDSCDAAMFLIKKDGTSGASSTDWYSVDSTGTWFNNPTTKLASRSRGSGMTDWVTVTLTDLEIPADGTAYFCLGINNADPGTTVVQNATIFHDIDIKYTPYVRGSRLSVKGDYWLTSQTDVITDKLEEEVYISDAPKRILKGALWNSAGTALTDPDWYRYGKTENRHFKEILNLGTFAHQYRGYRRISGSFKGVLWQSEIIWGVAPFHPPSLHHKFYFENEPFTDVRYYVFSAPMEIDWVNARFRTTLLEVFRDGAEWNTTGDSHTFGYIFQ